MTEYTKKDTNNMNWEEMARFVDILESKIKDYFDAKGEEINVVALLLRTGGIVGSMLAIKMKVATMLPVQFKYSYDPKTINQILSVPEILTKIPKPMNILLCEGNTSSGSIAMRAAKEIKVKYPEAKIYLATLVKVFGCPEKLEGIEEVFHGMMSDENFKASEEEIRNLGLRRGITIFPWEDTDDELSDVNAMQ